MKICPKCKANGPFSSNTSSYCMICSRMRARLDQATKRLESIQNHTCKDCSKQIDTLGTKWRCSTCAIKVNKARQLRYAKTKREVISHYGGECRCCGETMLAFLCLDHVANDGFKHRTKVGKNLWHWAKMNKFPPSLQLFCHNCNLGKHINGGVCPHVQTA